MLDILVAFCIGRPPSAFYMLLALIHFSDIYGDWSYLASVYPVLALDTHVILYYIFILLGTVAELVRLLSSLFTLLMCKKVEKVDARYGDHTSTSFAHCFNCTRSDCGTISNKNSSQLLVP